MTDDSDITFESLGEVDYTRDVFRVVAELDRLRAAGALTDLDYRARRRAAVRGSAVVDA